MQTLNDFIKEEQARLRKFKVWWEKNHTTNPEHFPLQMEDGNEGLWTEQLAIFEEDANDTIQG